MQIPRGILLCQYRYDPLGRLIANALPNEPERQHFYCKNQPATEIHGQNCYSIVQHERYVLAERQVEGDANETSLLCTDQQRSVLRRLNKNQPSQAVAYSPHGYHPHSIAMLGLLGFNGERPDRLTGCYILGNGYRAFSPVLMRFISSDDLSPFGKGGLNAYAYCLGNPVKYSDPSGRSPLFKSILKSLFGTFSDPLSKSWLPRFGHRSHSFPKRRFSEPGPTIPSLTKPDFIGYHGTSRDSANKLLKEGVLPQSAETCPGFFLSPDKQIATEYAHRQQYRSTKEDIWTFGKENILEVHVQNLTGKTPGKDYEFNYYAFDHKHLEHMTMEFMAMPHISRAVTIRQLGSTPANQLVRPRAFEAPF